jgi:hypothetical protein
MDSTGPPPEFFEALEKYPEVENAKSLLKGDDAYSKSLLALILTRISEDNDTEVGELLSNIDTKDNDIAMMLCFMTYEYRLEGTKGKNLILKRFGKAPTPAPEAEAEAPEAEAVEAVAPEAPEAEAPEAEAEAVAPEAPEAETPEAVVEEKPEETPVEPKNNAVAVKNTVVAKNKSNGNQKGGTKKKRLSKLRKTRPSRA